MAHDTPQDERLTLAGPVAVVADTPEAKRFIAKAQATMRAAWPNGYKREDAKDGTRID